MDSVEIPLYQPGETKVLRVSLTQDEWFNLASRSVNNDYDCLTDFITDILKEQAQDANR